MSLGIILQGMGGIEPKSVEVKLVNPVECIFQKKPTDMSGIFAVEIHGRTPGRFVPGGEIVGRVGSEVVAVRSQVVVNHIQENGHFQLVGPVHQLLQVPGGAIATGGCKKCHAIVTPVPLSGKVCYRHDFDGGDPQFLQVGKSFFCRREGSLRREGSHMQLVKKQLAGIGPPPVRVIPGKIIQPDNLRRAMYSQRLVAAGGIGKASLFLQLKAVSVSRSPISEGPGMVPLIRGKERKAIGKIVRAGQADPDLPASGCPYPKMSLFFFHPGAEIGFPSHGMHILIFTNRF